MVLRVSARHCACADRFHSKNVAGHGGKTVHTAKTFWQTQIWQKNCRVNQASPASAVKFFEIRLQVSVQASPQTIFCHDEEKETAYLV